jgi:hypothetical protein
MTSDGDRIEDNVRLIRLYMQRDGLDFDAALQAMGPVIPAGDHEAVRAQYQRQSSTVIKVLGPDVISAGGPRPWFASYDPSKGYYWRRQRSFLAYDLGRQDFEVDSLDLSSNEVLEHLEDPKSPDGFAVRGLVIGHVQSGKTQNFSALIAKSADAGYKIVIVLSGLHNTLRQQTQRRLERDLGRENVAGVGEPEAGKRWQWMTGAELWGDFNPGAVSAAVLQGNEQVIFVVKKNKTRLERLITWMSGRVPDWVPVLVIDDEADQASINTGGNRAFDAREEVDLVGGDFEGEELTEDELNPSAINLNIRKLINSFNKCSYVAYTATPFANVLIDPSARDVEGGNDLFPGDFIISLPSPPGDLYVGASRLFGRDRLPGESAGNVQEDGLPIVEFVPDYEVAMLLPPPRQRPGFVPILPETLKSAIVDYVLASAAWLERSGKDEPCVMLVHTAMQRALQDPLGPDIKAELAYIRQQWLYDSKTYRPVLKDRWDKKFRPLAASVDIKRDRVFEEIAPFIDRLLRDGIDVRILNSNWDDTVDFDEEPFLKAVIIGGNKLSRGLTLEGLLVSYYVRETLYYDTLMQMGRWFGYRGKYVDLTRLYSTEQLVEHFHDLATAEEELRAQIGRYRLDEKLTPRELMPKIRTHPSMAITAESKMQAAIQVQVSFAGEQVQTLRFPEKPTPALAANRETTIRLLRSLGRPHAVNSGKPSWSGVSPDAVKDFIRDFQVIDQFAIHPPSVLEYIDKQILHLELTQWRVLVSCPTRARPGEGWSDDLGIAGLPTIPLIARSRLANDPTSLGVVTEPDAELLGLSEEAKQEAEEAFADRLFPSRAAAYRSKRSPSEGLLVIYPISPRSGPGQNASANRKSLFPEPDGLPTLVAYSVSFPASRTPAAVEYFSAPRSVETL